MTPSDCEAALFRVFACLTDQHDWRLVAVSIAVCFFASITAVALIGRARVANGRTRSVWVATAGIASGCGIWATHFIAMLAYDPGVIIGYSIALTLLSFAVAVAVTSVGLTLAVGWRSRFAGAAGGAIVGAGIASMHYLGMAAVELPGHIEWAGDLVLLSVAFGMAFAAAALSVTQHVRGRRAALLAAALFTTAIISLHYTAMGAAEVVPDPLRQFGSSHLTPTDLAIVIAGVATALLGLSLVGSFADRLHDRDRRLAMAINNMTQGVVLYDTNNRLVVHNDRYVEMYGLSREVVKPGASFEAVMRHRFALGAFDSDPAAYCRDLMQAIRVGCTVTRIFEHVDGRAIAVVNQPLANGDWIGTHEDITDRRLADRRIAHMAHHDALTGLPNRAAFNDRLAAALAQADASRQNFAILCIDFDRLKEVNDLFGHAAGDAFLKKVSARMSAAAEGHFLARLSGDEFAMIVAGAAQLVEAEEFANRLLRTVSGQAAIEQGMVRVSLSIGVAAFPQHGADATTLLGNADAALYQAKANRGSVRVFDAAIDKRRRRRRELRLDLRSALARDEFRLHFQPQATIARKLAGFEALLRWQHPRRGLVMPRDFIALAEESGSMVEIGEWVLREACREAASWARPLQIAVNVSPVQFRHGDLAQSVHGVLLETGLCASRLEIEITEGVLVDDVTRALAQLRKLKALGVRIALDDFGAGYSSLSYLQAFPFDKIKIDQTFVSHLFRKKESVAIVRAIVGLAHALRIRVIAEGVETEDQLDVLTRERCDELQGYLIGRPRPIAEYASRLGEAVYTEPEASVA